MTSPAISVAPPPVTWPCACPGMSTWQEGYGEDPCPCTVFAEGATCACCRRGHHDESCGDG